MSESDVTEENIGLARMLQRRLHGGERIDSDEVRKAQDRFKAMKQRFMPLNDDHLDLLFREARTQYAWQDKEVSESMLREIYDLTKMGSTSLNSCPARFVFLRDTSSKQRLKMALTGNNIEKIMSAPVVVIIAHDTHFFESLDFLAPYADLKPMFVGNPAAAEVTAFRNGTLQGAYLMMAAKALGLDCGPMSGFDNSLIDQEFFADSDIRSNFLCCLGYGDPGRLFQRLPRFDFDSVCEML